MAGERITHVDLIVGLLAAFVGLLALGVSFYGVLLQRQQIRAQVWPRLQLQVNDTDASGANAFRIRLENVGVGAAEIQSIAVSVDGKPCADWSSVLVTLLQVQGNVMHVHSDLHDRVVGSGAAIDVLRGISPEIGTRLAREAGRLDVAICYCSVVGECWIMGEERKGTIAACPTRSVPFTD
jgi:hypothetical protein